MFHVVIQFRNAVFCAATFLIADATRGGTPDFSKEMSPAPTVTSSEPWHFNIGMPGWLANLSGTVGLHGVNSDVDIDTEQILRHTNFIMSLSAEARKGRFGFYGDFLYLAMDDAVYPERMVSKANINADQWLADGEVFYRVLEGPRGWLDLRAGARYYDVYSSLKLFGNPRLIDQAAANLVNAADADLRRLLEHLLGGALEGGNSPLPIPPLGTEEKIKLLKFIRDARMDPMTAQARIAARLNKVTNRSFSLTERWADPYLGIGGRYDLTKVFYLTGKADVGGFGVGSDITTQVSGAIGCHVTRRMYTELGYRFLYVDYEDDSNRFVWRTSTQGIQITSGISF